jgi:guanylate kinase
MANEPVGENHLLLGLYGVSGTGKSTVIDILSMANKALSVHVKDTTREQRQEKERDLRFMSEEEFRERSSKGEYEVIYHKYGHFYGVRRDTLLTAFERRELHCIIVRDITALQTLKRRYRLRALYFHLDPETAVEHVRRRNAEDQEERLRRLREEYKEYIDHNTLFDHVIVNFWDLQNAVLQVQRLIDLWDKQLRLT